MKSKFAKVAIGISVLLLTVTGCTRAEYSVQIDDKENGSSSFQVEIERDGLEKALETYDLTTQEFLDQVKSSIEKNSSEEENLKFEIIDTDSTAGFKTSNFGSLKSDGNLQEMVEIDKDNAKVTLPLNTIILQALAGVAEPEEVFSSFDVKIIFPGNVSQANYSGRIFGDTVTWGLEDVLASLEANEPLVATGSLTPSLSPIVIGGGIVGGLLIVVIMTLLLYRIGSKRKRRNIAAGLEAYNQTKVSSPQDWAAQQLTPPSASQSEINSSKSSPTQYKLPPLPLGSPIRPPALSSEVLPSLSSMPSSQLGEPRKSLPMPPLPPRKSK